MTSMRCLALFNVQCGNYLMKSNCIHNEKDGSSKRRGLRRFICIYVFVYSYGFYAIFWQMSLNKIDLKHSRCAIPQEQLSGCNTVRHLFL